jgi:purine-nucleoside phosphorylase
MTPPLPAPAPDLHTRAAEAAATIRAVAAEAPRVGIVLGSGLNELADRLADPAVIPYRRIPHFPATTVAGHEGRAIVGRLHDGPVLMFQGRFHFYEGHDLEAVTFPIRVLRELGVGTLILTAATGGIRAELRPGNLVLLTDHLNLIGANPLRGLNDERLGTRFPDMTEVYAKRLRALAREEGKRLGIELVPGVYACMPGPSYETPAEIRMLRTLGADVVGMSTVPEAIVARHAGMEVLGLALVSNAAAGVVGTPITHDEVLEAGRRAAPTLARLIERIVARLAPADAASS